MVKHQAATNSISELPLGAHGHEIFEIAGSYRGAGPDYLACPLTFFNGRHQACSFASDAPGGFSTGCFATLTGMLPALAAVIEARAMRRLAGTLLTTYLGRTAGQRILDGEIRRG